MNTKTVIRFYQTVKPHKPLIRFRYGTQGNNHSGSQSQTTPADGVHSLELNQLPSRFQRGKLDEVEINAINSGGAE